MTVRSLSPDRLPRGIHPGSLVTLTIAALVVAALAGLLAAGWADRAQALAVWPYALDLVRRASLQAAISTLVSVAFGTLIALALARWSAFSGRGVLLALMAMAVVAPTLVVVFGVVAVYGRSGLVAEGLAALGLPPPPSIFGLHGIVLAHVTLNAPFVARVLLAAFARQPAEPARLAVMLRFSAWDWFRHGDAPVLRRELPPLAALVFLLCFTSFAVVLALGGGPAQATLEVAIYEALRVEADFARAAVLASLQILLGIGFVGLITRVGIVVPTVRTQRIAAIRPDAHHRALRTVDAIVLALTVVLVLPPIAAVVPGLSALGSLVDARVGCALATSIGLALVAALACVAMALMMAASAAHLKRGRPDAARAQRFDIAALALIGVPPFAFVTGLYGLMRGWVGPEAAGFVLVPLINALTALPFVHRLVAPAVMAAGEQYGRLAVMLRLSGRAYWIGVVWPAAARPVLAGGALAAALSLGDYGVIALFGGRDLVTLPYLLADRMGAYRMAEASAIALLMLGLAGGLSLIGERWARSAGSRGVTP